MTTIAWDGRTLAADRRASGEGFAMTMTKIRRARDGRLVGATGNASAVSAMLDWLEGGADGAPPVPLDSNAWGDLIEVTPDGTVHYWGEHGRFTTHDTIAAIGSGMSFALAALACGRDAAGAIEVASMFDVKTGGGIDALDLLPPVRPRRTRPSQAPAAAR